MLGRDSYDARLSARRQAVLARSLSFERSQGTIRLSGVTGANIDITDFILAP